MRDPIERGSLGLGMTHRRNVVLLSGDAERLHGCGLSTERARNQCPREHARGERDATEQIAEPIELGVECGLLFLEGTVFVTVDRVTAEGSLVTLALDPVPGEYVLSDLSSGPVLFATC